MNTIIHNFLLPVILLLITPSAEPDTPTDNWLKIYAERRETLMNSIDDGVIILASGSEDHSERLQYRPANNFYYLTGLAEPGSFLVLDPGTKNVFSLVVIPNNPFASMWTGKQIGINEAKTIYGADQAYSAYELINKLSSILKNLYDNDKKIYTDIHDYELIRLIKEIIEKRPEFSKLQIEDLGPYINEMRVIKCQEEIDLLDKAIQITCESQREAYKACEPGMYEYEIEAIIEYNYRKNGATRPGFSSICGSGPNTTVLHYEQNDRKMKDGDLLLMDIGAEYGMYTADVTRTIPVNGIFSKEQLDIYELVLKSQEAAISELLPGKGVQEGHHASTAIIVDGLYELGLITDKNSTWQKSIYVMYPISHWIGLDVHDVGDYEFGKQGRGQAMFNPEIKGRELKPGMILTVEPGIYIHPDGLEMLPELTRYLDVNKKELEAFLEEITPVYQKYINIGVRIEDDILITDTGNRVLSAPAPKTVEDIENMMKEESGFR